MTGSRRPTSPRSPRSPGASRRPGSAARVRSQPAERPTGPPRGLSRRAAVLAVLALVIAVAVSPFVRAWVEQQSELAALETDIAERGARVDDLGRELGRWDDDAYVVAQARERFSFVLPGEVGYVVLDETRAEQDAADPTAAAVREVAADHGSWFAALWSSVEVAGGVAPDVVPDVAPDVPPDVAPDVAPAP